MEQFVDSILTSELIFLVCLFTIPYFLQSFFFDFIVFSVLSITTLAKKNAIQVLQYCIAIEYCHPCIFVNRFLVSYIAVGQGKVFTSGVEE
jgi:hypothetical protein